MTLRQMGWLCLLLAPVSAIRAESNVCSASYIANTTRGEQTIDQFGKNFQAINVYAYDFSGDCHVVQKSNWVTSEAENLRPETRRLILVTIVNEIETTPAGACRDLDPGVMLQYLFSDPARRAAHIRDIVAISTLARGVEIDYEEVMSTSTALFTQFMKELRAALPADKKLGIVVQPKTGSGEQGTPIDWRGIAPYVDYLRVMAYYYSWNTSPPGPVITYATLRKLATYILTNPQQSIPRSKARIILSLYGWDWPISPSGPGLLIRWDQAMAIVQANNITPTRDPTEDTLHFRYTDKQGTLHEVWIDDKLAEQKRIQLLLDMDFPAIDLWHLNTGDPALWPWFTPLVRSDCPSLTGLTTAADPLPQESQRAFVVGPNPWVAGQSTNGIHFFGVSADDVKIFTVSGQFVRRVRPLNGGADWDLNNENGEKVASGFYFYLATGTNGSTQKGVVAIVR